jgi:glyoxylase-like metal-dependent hydrolase (beta-lactamase superfamily II)
MFTISDVGAVSGSEAYLIITDEKTALVDSGFAFCADRMINNIKEKLGSRQLDYILLTHSHYDHASGSAYCRSVFKNVKIIASEYTKKIFEKPSAKAVMREMNFNAAKLYGNNGYKDELDKLTVDIAVKDGDIIDLGEIKLRVIEAPGHTKCSIAFFSEEQGLLISCETMGVIAGENMVMPCYLVGYEMSLDFIRKAEAINPRKILVPHGGILDGKECSNFIKNALFWNEEVKRRITDGFNRGKTVEQLIDEHRALFYTEKVRQLQPEKAFDLNAGYTIPMIINECV